MCCLAVEAVGRLEARLLIAATIAGITVAAYSALDAYGVRMSGDWLSYTAWLIVLDSGSFVIGMVLADLYTAISGIGYLIVRTASTYQVDKMFVPIVTLGVLGVTLTALLRVLEIKVAPWTAAGERD